MTDQSRYGRRTMVSVHTDFNNLRKVIRAEGTPAIQDMWDRIEPIIYIVLRPVEPDQKPFCKVLKQNEHDKTRG